MDADTFFGHAVATSKDGVNIVHQYQIVLHHQVSIGAHTHTR